MTNFFAVDTIMLCINFHYFRITNENSNSRIIFEKDVVLRKIHCISHESLRFLLVNK